MSNTMNTRTIRNYRHRLLGTASAIALTIYASGAAYAADVDRPILWIEGGWHFEDVGGSADPFVPPFDAIARQNGYRSATGIQNVLDYSYGGEGSISFQPENSDWVFTASLRYGRAHGRKSFREHKPVTGAPMLAFSFSQFTSVYVTPTQKSGYNDVGASNQETHAIIDFSAGKDVGLGLFGHDSSSVISLGARFAQLKTESGLAAYARPDGHFTRFAFSPFGTPKYLIEPLYHRSAFTAQRESTFRGIGPSLSWSNSTPLAGNTADGELALDWGVNAALLFGRQKTKIHRESRSRYYYPERFYPYPSYPSIWGVSHAMSTAHHIANKTRTPCVTVPNLGGFAGVSYKFTNAKFSIGYRVDYFFGALDGGVDRRHDINRSFNGPYASVSIGIGD